jgi:hypothetical protein
MKKNLIEIFGWYGTVAIVLAYILVSFSVISSSSLWYQLLNGTGALGLVADSMYKKDYQPEVLNLIWVFISVVAIFNILNK